MGDLVRCPEWQRKQKSALFYDSNSAFESGIIQSKVALYPAQILAVKFCE